MPFFKALAEIGVAREHLAHVDEKQAIRLEKQLIAAQRLNNNFSRNDVENIIKVLTGYPDVLEMLSRYDCLYGILTGYEADAIDHIQVRDRENAERIKLVLSTYFQEELNQYIWANINANNWNNIGVLLHYELFLSKEFVQTIIRRIESKFDQAFALLQEQPSHSKLNKELSYLVTDEFWSFLAQLDSRRFRSQILRFTGFMNGHGAYVSRTVFFNKLLRAMWRYNPTDPALRVNVTQTYKQHGGQTWISFAFFIGIFMIIAVPFICVNHKYASEEPPPERQHTFVSVDTAKENQRVDMESFIEARLYPMDYPVQSWKAPRVLPKKYANPFSSTVFSWYGRNTSFNSPPLQVFNRTNKECILLAYSYFIYSGYQQKYVPVSSLHEIPIYAIYIPPRDSIRIDANMQLLRFYMGKWLAGFNTYHGHIYPDADDVKFSKFTPADSLLFNRAFDYDSPLEYNHKIPLQIVVTQPNEYSYQLSWNGPAALRQRTNQTREIDHQFPDSASRTKPLVLDVRHVKKRPPDEEQQINSFLNP